jgi:hypothetical protein
MQISIVAHVGEAIRALDEVHRRHIPFASVYAATLTAKEVRVAEIASMHRVFHAPTPYTINALQVKPATMRDRVASVEFKEFSGKGTPAKRFLNPNIHGGGRSQKAHEKQLAALLGSTYLIPGTGVPKNAYGNVTGGTFMRILSQLKATRDPTQRASGSSRSKAKRKRDAYFVLKGRNIVMHRKGSKVTPVLIPIRPPNYRKRFPFYETAAEVVHREFPRQFVIALERAIATSNYKGKWR